MMNEDEKAFCVSAIYEPDASASDILEVLAYMRRAGAFRDYACRCFGPELSRMTEEELDAYFPDLEWVPLPVDDYLVYLSNTFHPYANEDDRLADTISRLLAGFEDTSVNRDGYRETARELER